MRLTELNPKWIHENVFIFDCPCCREAIISCKNVEMDLSTQFDIFIVHFGAENGHTIVPCKRGTAWTIEGRDFNTITVSPSIDASASGHWHGFIRNGEIV